MQVEEDDRFPARFEQATDSGEISRRMKFASSTNRRIDESTNTEGRSAAALRMPRDFCPPVPFRVAISPKRQPTLAQSFSPRRRVPDKLESVYLLLLLEALRRPAQKSFPEF